MILLHKIHWEVYWLISIQDDLDIYQLLLDFELAHRKCEYSFEVDTSCCLLYYSFICCFLYQSQELNLNSTDFYGLFNCCAVVPLSQVRGRVERSLTGLTPPHTLCACPKPGTCSSVVVVVFYCSLFMLLIVTCFFDFL